jgi:hypothetical protein
LDQYVIDRLVAAATGESVCFVHRRGFQHANPAEVAFDPEPMDLNTLQLLFANGSTTSGRRVSVSEEWQRAVV